MTMLPQQEAGAVIVQAEEFNAILAKLFPDSAGKGQTDAAKFLEIGGRTVRDYASGAREVPAPVAKFLRFLVSAGVSPAEVDAAIAGLAKKRRAKP